ncbi:MAG TPA: hypothetical protein VMG36_06665 [Thermoplasmata archaeon]|nr:hypothetical protein [Thermoplasmata archaeon]
MTDDPAPVARPGRVGPFVVFGAVAVAAGAGAVFEISYWVGVSAFSSGVIGTAAGIVMALVAFFAWGLSGPAND